MDFTSEKLSDLDLKEVLQVSHVALECDHSIELTKEVLRLMETVFRTSCSNFFFSLPWADELDVNRVISLTISEAFLDRFRKYYHKLDPFIRFYSLKYCPTTVSTEQILPYGKLTSGEYYNDFLKPQSIYSQMSIFLSNKNGLLGSFNLFRPPGGGVFTRRDRAKAELMATYLTEALNRTLISEKTATQTAMIDKILSGIPFGTVVLMNEWLEPIYCSEAAKKKLPGLCGIKASNSDCLRYLSKILNVHFGKQVLSADSGKTSQSRDKRIKMPAKKGNTEIIVRQVRMGNPRRTFFAVCLENEEGGVPTTREKEKLRSMGLTKREIEVVLLLSEGLKNPEIGKKLFISEHTVENHLRSIFRKMGVTNRTAATNRVLRIPRRAPTLFWLGEAS
jgi:DNA-binding NarL/FixJ family response regulator